MRHRGGPSAGFSFEGDLDTAGSIVTTVPVRPERPHRRVGAGALDPGGTFGDHTQDRERAEAIADKQDNQR